MRHPFGFAGHVHYRDRRRARAGCTLQPRGGDPEDDGACRRRTSASGDRGLSAPASADVVDGLGRSRRRLDGRAHRVKHGDRRAVVDGVLVGRRRGAHRTLGQATTGGAGDRPPIRLRAPDGRDVGCDAVGAARWATYGEDPCQQAAGPDGGLLVKEAALWVPTCGMATSSRSSTIAPRGAPWSWRPPRTSSPWVVGIEEIAASTVSLWADDVGLDPAEVGAARETQSPDARARDTHTVPAGRSHRRSDNDRWPGRRSATARTSISTERGSSTPRSPSTSRCRTSHRRSPVVVA